MVKRSLLTLMVACAAVLCLVTATAAQDRESVELSLDEALRMALKNNLDLVSASYAPDLAETDVTTQLSAFDAGFQTFYDRSESEQPASRSGRMTVFDGFTILAVSAMKCTPQKRITSASASAAR